MYEIQSTGTIDANLITVVKQDTGEQYYFIYEPHRGVQLIWVFMKFAMNRDLSFSWSDAASATRMVRQMAKDRRGPIFDNEMESG